MQSSGVGNCINMLAMTKTCRFPLTMLVTMRGGCKFGNRFHPRPKEPRCEHRIAASRPLHRSRSVSCPRRADCGPPVRRLGRQCDQDRAAGRGEGRCDRFAARRVRFPEPAPQQAQPDPQPENRGGEGDLLQAGGEGRRHCREFPLGGKIPPRRRLRVRSRRSTRASSMAAFPGSARAGLTRSGLVSTRSLRAWAG